MGVGKTLMIVIGIVCILLSVGPMIYSIMVTTAYMSDASDLEDVKDARDLLEDQGLDTSVLDSEIENVEDTQGTRKVFMGICYPISFILLIVGILLIIIGIKKGKKKE
jgi:uncharacterized membrane protein